MPWNPALTFLGACHVDSSIPGIKEPGSKIQDSWGTFEGNLASYNMCFWLLPELLIFIVHMQFNIQDSRIPEKDSFEY